MHWGWGKGAIPDFRYVWKTFHVWGNEVAAAYLIEWATTILLHDIHYPPLTIGRCRHSLQALNFHPRSDHCGTYGNGPGLRPQGLMAILRAPLLFILSKASL